MRFDWLKCRSAQLQFNIYQAPGQKKLQIILPKSNQPAAYHKALQSNYLAPNSDDKQVSMQGLLKYQRRAQQRSQLHFNYIPSQRISACHLEHVQLNQFKHTSSASNQPNNTSLYGHWHCQMQQYMYQNNHQQRQVHQPHYSNCLNYAHRYKNIMHCYKHII